MAECVVDGCAVPRRKREWCDRHYQAWRRHGDPTTAAYIWATQGQPCTQCGSTSLRAGSRRYCSAACQQHASRQRRVQEMPGLTWEERRCVSCDVPLNLRRTEGRATARGDKRFCDSCRSKSRRSYRLAVDILAHYQGTDCGICGQPIDMDVRFPNKRCASVDHEVPLALGGTDHIENLRLAHFDCNARRDALYLERSASRG